MFRRTKPASTIKVLAVKTAVRKFEEESTVYDGYSHYQGRSASTKKKYSHPVTTVLLSKDGELLTREFNGDWNLKDIKNWEDLDG